MHNVCEAICLLYVGIITADDNRRGLCGVNDRAANSLGSPDAHWSDKVLGTTRTDAITILNHPLNYYTRVYLYLYFLYIAKENYNELKKEVSENIYYSEYFHKPALVIEKMIVSNIRKNDYNI